VRLELAQGTLPPRTAGLEVIPNRKGEPTNPYDTGWQTKSFDLSALVPFDYNRLVLLLDDATATSGIYHLYVDYIRIE
jgi:hypothetical protein